ncbi:MAG: hypothetical protein LBH19_05270, partial [Dysgonamonadaceae bacterium]|nr:hypothetical protein [Dysgonamonadaceae bacterium]
MARKLQDDHIRWILDLDAKGVQGELQQITSESLRLANANKQMSADLKETEKAMKNAAKEMERLEKAGERGSQAHNKATETFHEAKTVIAYYREEIEKNTKSIDENNKKHTEIIKTMDIEDMTMSQLKQRASELQRQLNNTSVSLSPEAYKKLQRELEEVNKRMFTVQNTGKSMLSTFSSMHNPVGSAARAVQGFIQVLNFLVKHPIIAIIALVIGLFIKLKDALFKNEEAMHAINRIMAPLKALFDALVKVLQEAVIWVLKFVEGFLTGISKLIE